MALNKPAGAVKPLPPFVAIDFETTGFDRVNDRIIEIGAVRFVDGEPTAVFNTLVQYDGELKPEITKHTGHTSEDLAKGMEEVMAIQILQKFIASAEVNWEDSIIVGHNVLFDFEFLWRAIGRNFTLPSSNNPLIDTLTIGRDRRPYPHKLPDMCKAYSVTQGDWHSAYFDALACGELLLKMHKEKSVLDYINVIGWKRQYGQPEWAPDYVKLKPQGTLHVQEGRR